MRTALLMTDRVKLPTVAAKRFVRASARDALQDRLFAAAVAVALLRASPVSLRVLALEGLMSDLLAVITLLRPLAPLEHSGVARFASSVEETLVQEPTGVSRFRQVDDHRTVRFHVVLLA